MYPYPVHVFGLALEPSTLALLLAGVVGYFVFRRTTRPTGRSVAPLAWLRWAGFVYLSALSAQVFAYGVDQNTRILPPPTVNPLRYYLDPFYGPKTLYGVLLLLPLTALPLTAWSRDVDYAATLDTLSPAVLAGLAVCRIGCFFQGCCYGVRSDTFGIVFPPVGPVYSHQLLAGLIPIGGPTLPIVPAPLIEASVLASVAVWAFRELWRGQHGVFLASAALYSTARFGIEWVRDDPERNVLGALSVSQWVALFVVAGYGTWRRVAR